MTRTDRELLVDAARHREVLRQHLDRNDVDDQLVLDAAALRLSAAIDRVASIAESLRRRTISDQQWRAIRGMRNRMAHAYGFMDPAVLWSTLVADVAQFEADVHELITLSGE